MFSIRIEQEIPIMLEVSVLNLEYGLRFDYQREPIEVEPQPDGSFHFSTPLSREFMTEFPPATVKGSLTREGEHTRLVAYVVPPIIFLPLLILFPLGILSLLAIAYFLNSTEVVAITALATLGVLWGYWRQQRLISNRVHAAFRRTFTIGSATNEPLSEPEITVQDLV